MSRRINENVIDDVLARGRKIPFDFCKSKDLVTSRRSVTLFKIGFGTAVYAYLYLNHTDYTLVWKGVEAFDPRQPFLFIDLQFKNQSTSKLMLQDTIVPRPPHKLSGYNYGKCSARVLLDDEDEVREYGLNTKSEQDTYVAEFAHQPEVLNRVTFARYDSLIVIPYKNTQLTTSFTAEHKSYAGLWEFAIKVPRKLLLTERVLRWIARDPTRGDKSRRVDFERSLTSLHQLVKI